ncbi:MAG: nucleotidyltransferase family protein [Bacteroidota bacterium]|nr:nucleotidyltransferase family protein [Bacteroidota bacterium]
MKGVIFAAGLGTRLYPLTKDKPKALVEVHGMTMLEHTLRKMEASGIREIVVNIHAFARRMDCFLTAYSVRHPSVTIHVSDESDLLLETGGGIKKMQPLLGQEPFLVHNVDVLSTVNFEKLITADAVFFHQHEKKASAFTPVHSSYLATLAVRKITSDRYFLFNQNGLLCGWENVKTGEQKIARPQETDLQRYGFTGIHVIHPQLFQLMTETGVFSITDVYLRLAKDHEIRMFDVSDAEWFDIGSPKQLELAEQEWKER